MPGPGFIPHGPQKCSQILDDSNFKMSFSMFFDRMQGLKMPPAEVKEAEFFLSDCGAKQKKFLKVECDKYMATPSFKDGKDKDTLGYVVCCNELKFCSDSEPFYTQIWFFAVCGGVGLLLIGVIGIVVFLLCFRKKRGGGNSGGGGMKSSKKSKK